MVLTINHTWSWPQEKPHINVKNKLIDGPAKSLKRFDVRRRDPSSNSSVWALQIFVVYEPSLISPSLHKVRATEVRIIVSKKKSSNLTDPNLSPTRESHKIHCWQNLCNNLVPISVCKLLLERPKTDPQQSALELSWLLYLLVWNKLTSIKLDVQFWNLDYLFNVLQVGLTYEDPSQISKHFWFIQKATMFKKRALNTALPFPNSSHCENVWETFVCLTRNWPSRVPNKNLFAKQAVCKAGHSLIALLTRKSLSHLESNFFYHFWLKIRPFLTLLYQNA